MPMVSVHEPRVINQAMLGRITSAQISIISPEPRMPLLAAVSHSVGSRAIGVSPRRPPNRALQQCLPTNRCRPAGLTRRPRQRTRRSPMACFDEISHSALMDRVRKRIGDKRVRPDPVHAGDLGAEAPAPHPPSMHARYGSSADRSGATAASSSTLPDMIVRTCSVRCSIGQSHQASASRRSMSSSP